VILWNEYQSLLASLQEVVHGYPGSDIASVALRWLLQQDPEDEPSRAATMKTGGSSLPAVAGVVVTSQLHHHREKDDYTASRSTLSRRAQALRKVFTFSLSQAEMELINDLSGWWGFDADAGGELA
jgi:diketogulonate reductase-like aldo/keto reductase